MKEQRKTGQGEIEQAVVEGRIFTLQIEKGLLGVFKSVALKSGSTLAVIADKTGEKYPARVRCIGIVETEKDGSIKFYKWQVVTDTVKAGNIVIGVRHNEGQPGFIRFWQEYDKLNKQASKTPTKV